MMGKGLGNPGNFTSAIVDIDIIAQVLHIVICRDTDVCCECVRIVTRGSVRHITGILQRVVSYLEQYTLLRVHAASFARRHAKENVVEFRGTIDEVPILRLQGPLGAIGRVVVF